MLCRSGLALFRTAPVFTSTLQMTSDPKRPVILLAEDSDDDVYFFRWVARKVAQDFDIVCVPDGKEAVRVLAAGIDASGHRTSQCPDIFFLDLKMPMYSGFEVLQWMQSHPVTPPIPVAILSGSDHAADIDRAVHLGASAFFTKPISAPKMAEFLARCGKPLSPPPAPPAANGPGTP